jgi:hypothetical protein
MRTALFFLCFCAGYIAIGISKISGDYTSKDDKIILFGLGIVVAMLLEDWATTKFWGKP